MMNATNKWHVSYNSPIDYDIISSYDIFDPQNETLLFPGKGKNSRRFVVVDYIVHKLYSAKIKNYFKKNGILAKIVPFTSGEKNKSIDNYVSILRELNSFPIDRRSEPIIAIGGGC